MAFDTRVLTIDDYEALIELWAISGLPFKPKGRDSRELIAKEMAQPVVRYIGMFDGIKMIGVVIANFDGRRGWINRLAIDPDYRGKQLAAQLIEEAEAFLYDIGGKVICTLVEDMNLPSLSTFHKAGYLAHKEILYLAKRPSDEM